ncbi:MAG: primosomal replication protein N [Rhodocyclaceae bacterium]|nr:primosomal replication protein N [Rhodocyclaceae bacterium]
MEKPLANRVILSGKLAARAALRYTPAGIPMIDWRLTHASVQLEAARPRQVHCELDCVTAGALAKVIDGIPLGTLLLASGFLAAKSLRRPTPILHVTDIEFLTDRTKELHDEQQERRTRQEP